MDHLAKPLESLHARAAAFVADAQARLLHVPADPDLQEAALRVVVAQEWHPDNTRPFLTLTAATWPERTRELRTEYERQRVAQAENVALPPLPPLAGADPLATFVLQAQATATALTNEALGTTGVIIALAPEPGEDPVELARTLERLAHAPALKAARWVWISPRTSAADADIAAALGADAWHCPCRVDADEASAASAALLASMVAALASGAAPGGARPRTPPPPHPGDPPAPPSDGKPHAFLLPLLSAVQHLQADDYERALPLLQEARDLAAAAARPLEATEMEILLAVSAAHAHTPNLAPAVPLFHAAIARAEQAGLPASAAKAALLLGTFAHLAQALDLAAESFVRAAAFAQQADLPALELQALRLAGEVGLLGGARERGIARISEAVAVMAKVRPADAQLAGLDLLELCKRYGLDQLAKQARAALGRES